MVSVRNLNFILQVELLPTCVLTVFIGQTGVSRQTGTWGAVLISGGAVAQSQRLPLLPSELGRPTGALLLLAAQSRGALLGGRSQRATPLYLQRLELQQGTLQAEAEHARHTDPEINQVPGGVHSVIYVWISDSRYYPGPSL